MRGLTSKVDILSQKVGALEDKAVNMQADIDIVKDKGQMRNESEAEDEQIEWIGNNVSMSGTTVKVQKKRRKCNKMGVNLISRKA